MAPRKDNIPQTKQENTLKKKIEHFIEDDFDTLIDEIQSLDVKERVKIKLDLLKLVAPKPTESSDNLNDNALNSRLMQKLFGKEV